MSSLIQFATDNWAKALFAAVGSAVTWGVGQVRSWDKTRIMRRTLYRELAFNYDVLRRAFANVDFGRLLEKPENFAHYGTLISPYLKDLHWRDYARSIEDIETFNKVPEYHLFDMIYADIQEVIAAMKEGNYFAVFNRAYAVKGRLELAVYNEQLELKRFQDYPNRAIVASVTLGFTEASEQRRLQSTA